MGQVVDYYRPTGENSMSTMLHSSNNHLFSYDGIWWTNPGFVGSFLGSSTDWPKCCGIAADERSYIAFTGHTSDSHTGCGCCHNSYNDTMSWNRHFKMEYLM